MQRVALPLQHPAAPSARTYPQQPGRAAKAPAEAASSSGPHGFTLNTGTRGDVVRSLRRDWWMRVDELGVNVFGVPAATVQGRKRSRLLVCSGVAQSVVDSVHSEHDEFVFVDRRPKQDGAARRGPHPVETMNNTAWQRVRREAGRGGLHLHDLRHTAGMRLRDQGRHRPLAREPGDVEARSTGGAARAPQASRRSPQESRSKRQRPRRSRVWAADSEGKTGAAGRNRTHDPLVRSQVLYPAELQPRSAKLYQSMRAAAQAQALARSVSPSCSASCASARQERRRGSAGSVWACAACSSGRRALPHN